jgi:hypothetical protein
MRAVKKIGIAVAIAVIVLIATSFVDDAYNDYAIVQYSLSADENTYPNLPLEVSLYLKNAGGANAVPTSIISAVNATIQKVSIPSVTSNSLPRFCCYDDTTVTISNMTITAGQGLTLWAIVSIIPESGVSSFSITSHASVSFDIAHPKNTAVSTTPFELFYVWNPKHFVFNQAFS